MIRRPTLLLVLALFGGSLLTFPACVSKQPPQDGNSSSSLLRKSRQAYLKGMGMEEDGRTKHLKKARQFARTYLDRKPEGGEAGEAWYRISLVEYHFQNHRDALDAVENGLEQSRRPDVRLPLLMMKGKVSSALGNSEDALRAYREVKEEVKDSSSGSDWINLAELEYRRANMLVRNGMFGKARQVYQSLIDDYSGTEYAGKSRKKLRFMKDYFSIQLGLFRKRKNAISLKRKLDRDGKDAYILSGNFGGNSFYSVRLGKFNQYRKAERVAERLRNQGHDAIVKP